MHGATIKIMKGKVSSFHDMKKYREMEVWLHSFITPSLDEGGRSTSRPGHFTLGKVSSNHWAGSFISLRASVDCLEKITIKGFEPRFVKPVASRCTD